MAKPFAVRWVLCLPSSGKLPSLPALRLFWFAVLTACHSKPLSFDEDLYTFSLQEFCRQFESVRSSKGGKRQIHTSTIRKAVGELQALTADFDGERSFVFGSEKDDSEKGRRNSIWIPSDNWKLDGTKEKTLEQADLRKDHIYFNSEFILEDNLFHRPEQVAPAARKDYIPMDYRFLASVPTGGAKAVTVLYPLYLTLDRYLEEAAPDPVELDADFLMAAGGYAHGYSFPEYRSAFFKKGWDILNRLLGKDIQYQPIRTSREDPGAGVVLFHRGARQILSAMTPGSP